MSDPIVFPNLWDIRYLGKKKCLLVVLGRLLELAKEDVRIAEIAVRAPFRAPVTKLLGYFQPFLHKSSIIYQYCGSKFFYPDPGSRVRKIPDPGSGFASMNLSC
jgi:hypothetical protein